jgi:hypothetical protein
MRAKVYVFSSGPSYGFSVLSNGSNLPRLLDGTSWKPLRIKLSQFTELTAYIPDVTTARFNLLSRGYHLCTAPRQEITAPTVAA